MGEPKLRHRGIARLWLTAGTALCTNSSINCKDLLTNCLRSRLKNIIDILPLSWPGVLFVIKKWELYKNEIFFEKKELITRCFIGKYDD